MSVFRKEHVPLGSDSYDIHIGRGVLEEAASLLPLPMEGRKVFILYDRAVKGLLPRLKAGIRQDTHEFGLNGGEKTKSFDILTKVTDWLLSERVERTSLLFVVGGGVIGDLGGFAASITLRGIPFVQIPTTLLSQVDSSVGGKTGINTAYGKNLIGSFYQPAAVLCDVATLETLPEREMKAGYAEIVKYGLLGDFRFFEWLESNAKKVLSQDVDALTSAIAQSCRAKADIVGDDERERAGGKRALLNLGHTFAHALEAAAGYDGRLLHGEAVSIGLVLAFRVSAEMGLCTGQDASRVETHLRALDLKTRIADIAPALACDADRLIDLMHHDKKASGGKIGFVLVRKIGEAFQTKDVDMGLVRRILQESAVTA